MALPQRSAGGSFFPLFPLNKRDPGGGVTTYYLVETLCALEERTAKSKWEEAGSEVTVWLHPSTGHGPAVPAGATFDFCTRSGVLTLRRATVQ